MTLYSIYEIAAKNNIEIIDMKLRNSKAKIVKCYDQICIALDKKQIVNTGEEKQILMICLGHYFSNSLYSINDTPDFISNCNYAAKKWICNNLDN